MKKRLIYIAIGICAFLIGILLFDADIFAISLWERTCKVLFIGAGIYFITQGFRKTIKNEQK